MMKTDNSELIEIGAEKLSKFLEENNLWEPLLKAVDKFGIDKVVADILDHIKKTEAAKKEVQA